jgi:hypothetical protein
MNRYKMSDLSKQEAAYPSNDPQWGLELGLSKRELFAAMAMQGLLSRDAHHEPDPTALESVLQADALLAALEVKADEDTMIEDVEDLSKCKHDGSKGRNKRTGHRTCFHCGIDLKKI